MQYFSMICSIIAALAGLGSIFTFLFTREKESRNNFESEIILKNDLKHLREQLDTIRIELKEALKKQEELQVRSSENNIRLDNIEKRLKALEEKVNG